MKTTETATVEMQEFSVGDQVWWAHCGTEEAAVPCPICFGKCVVTLILGNAEQVQTPCDFCGKGFEGSRGVIHENQWKSAVKSVPITAKQVSESNGEREVEYIYDNWILRPDNTFRTKDGAEKRVLELIDQHNAEEKGRLEMRKEHDKKSYAWHVGYHKRCAKEAKRNLEYHEKKAITMKELSRHLVPSPSLIQEPHSSDL